MITPTSGSITTEPQTYDGIWLLSVNISAPNPQNKIMAVIRTIPFNSSNGSMAPMNYAKNIIIPDVISLASSSSLCLNAMESIFAFTQDYIISKSLF